jgi:molecular chaperone GrpE
MGRHGEKLSVIDRQDNPLEEPVEIDLETGQPTTSNEDEAPERQDDTSADAEQAEAGIEVARLREAMLRMQAETENLRKRLNRELEKSRRFALEGFMKDLLQVRDSLERGLELEDEALTVQALREGQELTLRMLGKVMQDHHLQLIDPVGEPFDPELHEAMTTLPSEDVEENTVIEVLQKGFSLHDRLIRPARVVVSRKP